MGGREGSPNRALPKRTGLHWGPKLFQPTWPFSLSPLFMFSPSNDACAGQIKALGFFSTPLFCGRIDFLQSLPGISGLALACSLFLPVLIFLTRRGVYSNTSGLPKHILTFHSSFFQVASQSLPHIAFFFLFFLKISSVLARKSTN